MSSSLQVLLRAPLVLGTAAVLHLGLTAPPRVEISPDARDRLAAGIATATGLVVTGRDLVFETTRPVSLRDALWGRAVMFTARETSQSPRDVYRAVIRLTPDGQLLGTRGMSNLTRSPLGDDGPLVADVTTDPDVARRVAFAVRAFGQVQSAAVLDPRGRAGEFPSLRRWVTNVQETGHGRGVDRWDIRLDRPVTELTLRWMSDGVQVQTESASWRVDPALGLSTPEQGVTITRAQPVDKPPVIWAVDTVRGLSFVGPAPIAWLEEHVFGLRDRWHQLEYRWLGRRPSQAGSEPVETFDSGGNVITAQAVVDTHDPHWPPPRIAPQVGSPEQGEGAWVQASPPWLRHHDGAPPAFYRTFLRLDRERPYSRVIVLAMDMRQLSLGMQAGVEDPVPMVGPRGDGRLPRRPEVTGRVVAAFNGAFKSEHGEYGMVVQDRVLLPPRPHAATVAVLDDGRVAMGTWGDTADIPPIVSSLRQNLDPLVADGVENPTHRGLWGFVLGGIESMPTVRSGMCRDAHGHMFYVWGEETTARMLGRAMHLAGCDYGMHLDMNPTHASFHFVRVEDLAHRQFQWQPLVSGMQSHGDRFLYYTLKDFFYVTLRPTTPPEAPNAPWSLAPVQPAPTFLPALLTATVSAGERALRVTSLDTDRVHLHLRAGRSEPLSDPDAGATTLAVREGMQVLAAVELGLAPSRESPRGVMIDGRACVPFVATLPSAGYLAFTDAGPAVREGATPSPDVRDAVQGVVVRVGGAARAGLTAGVAPRRVVALTGDHRMLVLEGDATPEALDEALEALGARDAIALVGAESDGAVHWSTEASPVLDSYPDTTAFVTAGAYTPPAVRLEALRDAAPAGDPRAAR